MLIQLLVILVGTLILTSILLYIVKVNVDYVAFMFALIIFCLLMAFTP